MLNKIIFDFGSDKITVFAAGKIVFKQPSAIIITKSLYPHTVEFGTNALLSKDQITEDEIFILPIKKGAVAHFDGVKLLIKSIVKQIGLSLRLAEICILVCSCLDIEQKKDIERAFIGAGCTNIYLMERLLPFHSLSKEYKCPLVCFIGGQESDIGILNDSQIISGYCLDLGIFSINDMLKTLFESSYKINIPTLTIQDVLTQIGSLHSGDFSRKEIAGTDIVSGLNKSISISAKDIFSTMEHVYSRILKVIEASLMSAPQSIVQSVAENGILFAGVGVSMQGFAEYAYKRLKVYPIILEDMHIYLAQAYSLISDEKWLSNYLGIDK